MFLLNSVNLLIEKAVYAVSAIPWCHLANQIEMHGLGKMYFVMQLRLTDTRKPSLFFIMFVVFLLPRYTR